MDSCHRDQSENALQGDAHSSAFSAVEESLGIPRTISSKGLDQPKLFETLSGGGGLAVTMGEKSLSPHGCYNQDSLVAEVSDSNVVGSLQQKPNGAMVRRISYGCPGKHALRQQARRRRRNTSIAAGNSPPITRVTMKTGNQSASCSPSAISPSTSQQTPPLQSSIQNCQHSPQLSGSKHFSKITPSQLTQEETLHISGTGEEGIIKIFQGNSPNISLPVESSLEETYSSNFRRVCSEEKEVPRLNNRTYNYSQCIGNTIRTSQRLANSNANSSGSLYQGITTVSFSNSIITTPTTTTTSSSSQGSRTLRLAPPQSSPSTRESSSLTTMQSYLASIPGYKPRKRSQRKLSTAAQLAQTDEGNIDLETPDSILVNVSLKGLVNKHTFASLSPVYQKRLSHLLPQVDVTTSDNSVKVIPTALNNEFLGRACESWRVRLSEGEFTHDNQIKLRGEAEKERFKLDPWKVAHFEPVWGMKHGCHEDDENINSPKDDTTSSMSSSPEFLDPMSLSSFFTNNHIRQLTKVVEHIVSHDARKSEVKRIEKSRNFSNIPISHSKQPQLISYTENELLSSVNEEEPETFFPVTSTQDIKEMERNHSSCSNSHNFESTTENIEPINKDITFDPTECVNSEELYSDVYLKRKGTPTEAEQANKKLCVSDEKVSFSNSDDSLHSYDSTSDYNDTFEDKTVLSPVEECSQQENSVLRVVPPSNFISMDDGSSNPLTVSSVSLPLTPNVIKSSALIMTPASTTCVTSSFSEQASLPVSNHSDVSGIPQSYHLPLIVTSTATVSSSKNSPFPRTSPLLRKSSSCISSSQSTALHSSSYEISQSPSPCFVMSPIRNSSNFTNISSTLRTVSSPNQQNNHMVSQTFTAPSPSPPLVVTSGFGSLPSPGQIQTSPNPKRSMKNGQQVAGTGGTVTVHLNKAKSPGSVNLQRSYEIIKAVIANSPNRDQLQAQLKPPSALMNETPISSSPLAKHPIESPPDHSFVRPQQQDQFISPKGVLQSSSVHPQTIAVVKANIANSSASTAGQFVSTGQRIFRSVALPVAALNPVGGNAVTLRPIVASQIGIPISNGQQAKASSSSINQVMVNPEPAKPSVAVSCPITILRPTSGGKPVYLRTVSLSNVQLVRVSDIFNGNRTNSKADLPPRASSAPPSRTGSSCSTGGAIIPRPSSVGPRILIPATTTSLSGSTLLPPPLAPPLSFPSSSISSTPSSNLSSSGPFLVERDLSSGVNNNCNTPPTTDGSIYTDSAILDGTCLSHLPSVVESTRTGVPDNYSSLHDGVSSNNDTFQDMKNDVGEPECNNCTFQDEGINEGHSMKQDTTESTMKFQHQYSELNAEKEDFYEGMDNDDIHGDACENLKNSSFCEHEELPPYEEECLGTSSEDASLKNMTSHGSVNFDHIHSHDNENDTPQDENKEQLPMQDNSEPLPSTHETQSPFTQPKYTVKEEDSSDNTNPSYQNDTGNAQQAKDYPYLYMQKGVHSQQMLPNPYIMQNQQMPCLSNQQQQHPMQIKPECQDIPMRQNIVCNLNPVIPMASFQDLDNYHMYSNNNRINNANVMMNGPASSVNESNNYPNQDLNSTNESLQKVNLLPPAVTVATRDNRTNKMTTMECSNIEGNSNSTDIDNVNEDGCPCNMRAMVMCMKCGAFCHHDCISPSRLCVTCLIR